MECRRSIRKKTELEHILKKENIDICCIQETHLQKDKRFRVRGYQCFRTDREGDKRKGGVLTLIRSSINAYMSNSSTHSAENQTMIIQTTNRNFTIVNYYCPNNVNLNIQNINVKSEDFIIVGDFNSHSQSWGYNHIDNHGEEIED